MDTEKKYTHDDPYMFLQTLKVSNGFKNTEAEINGRIFNVLIFLFLGDS
jgi:hypothetical protein